MKFIRQTNFKVFRNVDKVILQYMRMTENLGKFKWFLVLGGNMHEILRHDEIVALENEFQEALKQEEQ